MAILQSLKHDRIVQVYDLFDSPTDSYVYFVMEFCQGGELFERIVAKTTYNEKEARDVIRTLLSALSFCHDEAKVVHRDLKVGPPSLPPSLLHSLFSSYNEKEA